MPIINLSGIWFRPYSEGEEPTEFGSGDYTTTSGAVNLSGIKFRPWRDPVLTSIGGTGSDSTPSDPGDEDEGGGGGPGPGDHGSFALFALGIDDGAVYERRDSGDVTQTMYGYVEFYIPSASYTTALGFTFSGEPIDLSVGSSPTNTWQGIFITNRNASNVVDGNLYLWDYWGLASTKVLIAPDTWYTLEVGVRPSMGVEDYETSWKVDGVTKAWAEIDDGGAIGAGFRILAVGNQFGRTNIDWYVDNAKYALDNWISEGGTVEFEDDFESGDTSAWFGSVGTVSTVTPP